MEISTIQAPNGYNLLLKRQAA